MHPIIRNILAMITGWIVGSMVNMGIITMSGSVIAPPEGADVTTMEGLKASLHLFEPKHFVFPFFAHALGSFSGALLAAIIAANHKMKFALSVSVLFLAGGVLSVFMLPSPTWFSILDLTAAYLPMGFVAGKIVARK